MSKFPDEADVVTDPTGLNLFMTSKTSGQPEKQLDPLFLPVPTTVASLVDVKTSYLQGQINGLAGTSTPFDVPDDLSEGITGHVSFNTASGDITETVTGGTVLETGGTIASATGIINGARLFDEADTAEFVAPVGSDAFDTQGGSFGFAVWVKPTTIGGTRSVLQKGQPAADGTNYDWILYVTASNVTFGVIRAAPDSGSGSVSAGEALTIGDWNYVQCWFDGASLNIRINNGAISSVSHSFGVRDTNDARPMMFGYGRVSGNTAFNWFDGALDDFIFWRGTSTVSNLDAIYSAGTAGVGYPYPGITPTGLLYGMAADWGVGYGTRERPDSSEFSRTLAAVSAPVAGSKGWTYDGTDDAHSVTDDGIEFTAASSILCYIKPSSITGLRGVLGRSDGSGNEFSLALNAGVPEVHYKTSSTAEILPSTEGALTVGQRAALLVSSDGANVRITNYGQTGQDSEAGVVDSVSAPFQIGFANVSATASERWFLGDIGQVRYFQREISLDAFTNIVDNDLGIEVWSDSLGTPTEEGGGGNWTGKLSTRRDGFRVYPHHYPGKGYEYIRDQFVTFNDARVRLHVFMGGNNSHPLGVDRNLDPLLEMTNSLRTDRFLVLGIPNRSPYTFTDEQIAAAQATMDEVNDAIKAVYGDRFVDLQAELLEYNGDANDDIDIGRGIVPRGIKHTDNSHFNSTGGTFISQIIEAKLIALGWGV